jgi:hypothetical protein
VHEQPRACRCVRASLSLTAVAAAAAAAAAFDGRAVGHRMS